MATEEIEKSKISDEIGKLESEGKEAAAKVPALQTVKDQDLVLRAPCSGIVGQAPSIDDISKFFPADPNTPFCTINEPGRVRVCVPIVTPTSIG